MSSGADPPSSSSAADQLRRDQGGGGDGGGEGAEEGGASRIADPENYNLRRRLQQLHDAKERVRSVGENATLVEVTDESFTSVKKDTLVAEAVADFILELRPVLADEEKAEAFLDEDVSIVNGDMVTIRDYAEALGRLRYDPERVESNPLIDLSGGTWEPQTPPYAVSMMAREVCYEYFNELAEVDLEENQRTVIDEKLIKEVEEWRKANLAE